MASLLQGFEEVRLVKPVGKIVMTVTDNAVRFNKATAVVLGYPAFVKVLINERTKQIAITPTTAKADNGIKFSKGEGKQAASITVRDAAVVEAIKQFFEIAEVPEDQVAYQSVLGESHPNDKAVIFDANKAEAGVMKRRGRKKTVTAA